MKGAGVVGLFALALGPRAGVGDSDLSTARALQLIEHNIAACQAPPIAVCSAPVAQWSDETLRFEADAGVVRSGEVRDPNTTEVLSSTPTRDLTPVGRELAVGRDGALAVRLAVYRSSRVMAIHRYRNDTDVRIVTWDATVAPTQAYHWDDTQVDGYDGEADLEVGDYQRDLEFRRSAGRWRLVDIYNPQLGELPDRNPYAPNPLVFYPTVIVIGLVGVVGVLYAFITYAVGAGRFAQDAAKYAWRRDRK